MVIRSDMRFRERETVLVLHSRLMRFSCKEPSVVGKIIAAGRGYMAMAGSV